MTATPTKLRDGSWGARVQEERVREGDEITITTRAGKSWTARVSKVIWRGDGISIVATNSGHSSQRGHGHPHRYSHECECGAMDDMLSMGYGPGERVRCPECGGWAEAC